MINTGRKKNLIIDFDNTQFDTFPVLARYVNMVFGINSQAIDYTKDSLENILISYGVNSPYSKDEIYYYFIRNFQLNLSLQLEAKPMPGFLEVLPIVASEYNIYTSSARQKVSINCMWQLYEHYGLKDYISGIHCVWEWQFNRFKETPKIEFIKSLPGEIIAFIDDSIIEIEGVQNLVPSYQYGNYFKDWYELGKHFCPELF